MGCGCAPPPDFDLPPPPDPSHVWTLLVESNEPLELYHKVRIVEQAKNGARQNVVARAAVRGLSRGHNTRA